MSELSESQSEGIDLVSVTFLTEQCEFATKDDDCRWCAQRGLTCGDKLLGEKHQIREHRKRLGIGNTPLSTIAGKLELAYPRHTPWEICEIAREILLENGDGPDDLSTLSRQNSQSHEGTPSLHCSMLNLRPWLNSSTPSSRVGETRKQSQNTPSVNPISNLPRCKSTSVSPALNPHRRPPRSQHNHQYRPFTSLSGLQFYNQLLYRNTHPSNLRRSRSDFRSLYFHSSESGTLT